MANCAARILLKNGKSFPQLLRNRLVGRPSSNVNKNQLLVLAQPLTNPTRGLYLQRPMLGDGFNFVDFVLGKDQELPRVADVEAREGKTRLVNRYDDDDDDDDDDDELGDIDDNEDSWDEESDVDPDDGFCYNIVNEDEDDETDDCA